MRFTKIEAADARTKIEKALEVLRENGFDASIGNIRFDEEIRTTLTLRRKREIQVGIARVVSHTDANDVPQTDYGFYIDNKDKTVMVNGSEYTLIEYKKRNPKYPFIIKSGVCEYKVSRRQIKAVL